MAEKADDSSDSDIFVQGGGPRLVSIYASLTKGKGDQIEDDSDDEDDIVFISDLKKGKGRKKRGRGKREHDGPYKANNPDVDDVNLKDDSNPSKRLKISVFDSPSADDDDDIQEVLPDSPYYPKRDTMDIEAERTSLLAKAALANNVSEARIADEVRLETRQENRTLDNEKRRQTLQASTVFNPSNQSTKQGIPILLKVQCESHVAKMRIRTSDPLIKMLDRFCEMFKLNRTSAVMEVDGEEVGPDDTPETCDLEANMVVDVHIRKK